MDLIPRPRADGNLYAHGGVPPGGPALLDFSSSVNPLGPPAPALDAARAALADAGRYPDPQYHRLTRAVADAHGVHTLQVLVGNGASELIDLVARTVRPRRAAVIEPTYTEYLRACRLASPRTMVDHWLPGGDDLRPFPADRRPDLAWLCQPNNPTGRLVPRDRVLEWVAGQPRTRFVVDESFLGFRPDAGEHTLIPWLDRPGFRHLVVLRSLTKLYALPGLRLGCLLVPVNEVQPFWWHRVPWSVNAPAAAAGAAALADDAYLGRTHQWFTTEVPRFEDGLWELPAETMSSAANFFTLRTGLPAAEVARRMAGEHGIAVREASNFVGLDDRCVRVAVRTRAENERLFAALRAVLTTDGESE